MRLRAKGIENDNGSVGKVIWASVLSGNDEGVGRGRGIRDASKVLEAMREAAGARRQA